MISHALTFACAFHQSYTNRVSRIIPDDNFLDRVFKNPLIGWIAPNSFIRSLVLSSKHTQAHVQPKIYSTTANEWMKNHFKIISTKYKKAKWKQEKIFIKKRWNYFLFACVCFNKVRANWFVKSFSYGRILCHKMCSSEDIILFTLWI